MATALLSFGSNLGDRAATLDSALAALTAAAGVTNVRRSRWYETAPVGGPGFQQPFLNGAALIETSLEPLALLDLLQRIETDHGRIREEHWGPRTLDLDLLTYDDLVLESSRLKLPHPRLSYRKFVLDGVVEIAPDMRHPLQELSFADLRKVLDDLPNYVAFVSGSASLSVDFRSQFAAEAADCAGAKLIDATPHDVPPFAELISWPRLDDDEGLKFVEARQKAICDSLADAGERWIIDDGWLPAEAIELVSRIPENRNGLLGIVAKNLGHGLELEPKLLAVLRTKNTPSISAVEAVKQSAPGVELPPIIDLDISDRERALTEFAAALDAAR